eukprot:1145718-Pelagomonas_calceolata.AAC.3
MFERPVKTLEVPTQLESNPNTGSHLWNCTCTSPSAGKSANYFTYWWHTQDSREASETSQDGTFHLNRGEKADKTAGTKDRRNSAPASDSFINENEHYASIDIRSKRTLPELPAMVLSVACALDAILALRSQHKSAIPWSASKVEINFPADVAFLISCGEGLQGLQGNIKGPLYWLIRQGDKQHATISLARNRCVSAASFRAAAALQKLLAAVRILDIVEVSRLLKLGAPVNEPNPDIDVSHMKCLLPLALPVL